LVHYTLYSVKAECFVIVAHCNNTYLCINTFIGWDYGLRGKQKGHC